MSATTFWAWAPWALFMVGLTIASLADSCSTQPPELICPAGYSTEYTSSGHKFCLRIMQDCTRKRHR